MFGNIQLCPSVNDLAVDLRWWRIWRWFHQICPSLFHPLCEIYQYHWQQSSPRASCYHHHAWSWYSALRFESFNIISPHMPHCGQLPPFSSCAIKHFSRKHLACRCEQFQSTTRVSTLEQRCLSWFLVGSWLHCVDSDAGVDCVSKLCRSQEINTSKWTLPILSWRVVKNPARIRLEACWWLPKGSGWGVTC